MQSFVVARIAHSPKENPRVNMSNVPLILDSRMNAISDNQTMRERTKNCISYIIYAGGRRLSTVGDNLTIVHMAHRNICLLFSILISKTAAVSVDNEYKDTLVVQPQTGL